jgi:hypothetical protein
MHEGVVVAQIVSFDTGSSNLTLEFKNLHAGELGSLGVIGITDSAGKRVRLHNSAWDERRLHNWLDPEEVARMHWHVPDDLQSPWVQLDISYVYGRNPSARPTMLACQLDGDNIPEAFLDR